VNPKFRAYLELVRVGNLFSAGADILAAHYYAAALAAPGDANLPTLLAASSLLYAGGVAINDVCDAKRDTIERPERPIPSGRVSRAAALRLSIFLLGTGTVLAMSVSLRSTILAGFLVGSILLYNLHANSTAFAPLVMGACRGLNVALGLDALPTLADASALAPILLMWLYIASVTYFARDEAATSSKRRLVFGTIGVAAATLGLVSLLWLMPDARRVGAGMAVGLSVLVTFIGLRGAASPEPAQVQGSVRGFLIALIAFDAVLAGIAAGPVAARNVALFALPMIAITKRFRAS
jgi:4-hydroxybenzoate polyprenyltransferase